MIHTLITKLEVDLFQARELDEAVPLLTAWKIPAIVVHQDLVAKAMMLRAVNQAKFKIFAPFDSPKGLLRSTLKFRDVALNVLSADGFEVQLSSSVTGKLANQEISEISELVRKINPMAELRFVLGALSTASTIWTHYVEAIKKFNVGGLIRTDHHTSIQQSKANCAVHTTTLEQVRAITSKGIKLSGNISSLKVIAKCPADRYGVNFKQVRDIVGEIQKDPRKYEDLVAQFKESPATVE